MERKEKFYGKGDRSLEAKLSRRSMIKKAAFIIAFALALTVSSFGVYLTGRAADNPYFYGVGMMGTAEGVGNAFIKAADIEPDADRVYAVDKVVYFTGAAPESLYVTLENVAGAKPYLYYASAEHLYTAPVIIPLTSATLNYKIIFKNEGGAALQTIEVRVGFVHVESTLLFGGGSGTKESPYIINNYRHLDNMRLFMRSCFRLEQDIDLANYRCAANDFEKEAASDNTWRSVGYSATYGFMADFEGVLNPDNTPKYEIRNFRLNNAGFFNYLSGGRISGIRFTADSSFDSAAGMLATHIKDTALLNLAFTGNMYTSSPGAGAVAGQAEYTAVMDGVNAVDGVKVNVNITNPKNQTEISGIGGAFGTLRGAAGSAPVINGLSVSASIEAGASSGGIAGYAENIIFINSSFTGSIGTTYYKNQLGTGGLAGRAKDITVGGGCFADVYISSLVPGSHSGAVTGAVGGIAGYAEGALNIGDGVTVTGGIAADVITSGGVTFGGNRAGGVVGQSAGVLTIGSGLCIGSAAQPFSLSGSSELGGAAGLANDVMIGDNASVYLNPVSCAAGGSADLGGVIGRSEGLVSIGAGLTVSAPALVSANSDNTRLGNNIGGVIGCAAGAQPVDIGAGADITAGKIKGGQNLGAVTGVSQGAITIGDGLTVSAGDFEGLAYIGGAAGRLFRSVNIGAGADITVRSVSAVSGAPADSYFGGVIGRSGELSVTESEILSSKVGAGLKVSVTVISGKNYAGGFAGSFAGIVSGVTAGGGSFSVGALTGNNYVGGFAGEFTGEADGAALNVALSGVNYVGGFAGVFSGRGAGNTVKAQLSGTSYVGGFAGAVTGSAVSGALEGTVVQSGSVLRAASFLGGFAGRMSGGAVKDTVIEENITLTAPSYVGGFAGGMDGGAVSGSDIKVSLSGAHSYAGGFAGYIEAGNAGSGNRIAGNIELAAAGLGYIGGFAGAIGRDAATGGTVGDNNIVAVPINSLVTTAKNLYIGGFAGYTGGMAAIGNSNSYTGKIYAPKGSRLGGFIGCNTGSIGTGSYVDASIAGDASSSECGLFIGCQDSGANTVGSFGVSQVNTITAGSKAGAIGCMLSGTVSGRSAAEPIRIYNNFDIATAVGGFAGQMEGGVIRFAETYGSVRANSDMGGFVGLMRGGYIENCGAMQGAKVERRQTSGYIGGFAGSIDFPAFTATAQEPYPPEAVKDCVSYADVITTVANSKDYAGGFAGAVSAASVSHSSSYGSVSWQAGANNGTTNIIYIGGFVGHVRRTGVIGAGNTAYGTVKGRVAISSSQGDTCHYIGGFAGYNAGRILSGNTAYGSVDTSADYSPSRDGGGTRTGGFVGENNDGGFSGEGVIGKNCRAYGDMTGNNCTVGGFAGMISGGFISGGCEASGRLFVTATNLTKHNNCAGFAGKMFGGEIDSTCRYIGDSIVSYDDGAGAFIGAMHGGIIDGSKIDGVTYPDHYMEVNTSVSTQYGTGGFVCEVRGGTLKNIKYKGTVIGGDYVGGFVAFVSNDDVGTGVPIIFENCYVMPGSSVIQLYDAQQAGGFIGQLTNSGVQPAYMMGINNCVSYADVYVKGKAPNGTGGFIGNLRNFVIGSNNKAYGNVIIEYASAFSRATGGFIGRLDGSNAIIGDNNEAHGDVVNMYGGTGSNTAGFIGSSAAKITFGANNRAYGNVKADYNAGGFAGSLSTSTEIGDGCGASGAVTSVSGSAAGFIVSGFGGRVGAGCFATGAVTALAAAVNVTAAGFITSLTATGIVGPGCYASGAVVNASTNGSCNTAGFIGINSGRISAGCYSLGSVTAAAGTAGGFVASNNAVATDIGAGPGIYENCYAKGAVTGANGNTGGFTGNNSGAASYIYEGCYAAGDVRSTTGAAGGFTGANNGKIFVKAYASGNVYSTTGTAGGFAGTNTGEIGAMRDGYVLVEYNCRAFGSVQSSDAAAGGFIGGGAGAIGRMCTAYGPVSVGVTTTARHAGGFAGTFTGASLKDCYAYGDVDNGSTGAAYTGGFAGQIGSAAVTGCISYGSASAARTVGGFAGSVNAAATLVKCISAGARAESRNNQNMAVTGGFAGIVTGAAKFVNCASRTEVRLNNSRAVATNAFYAGGFVGQTDSAAAYYGCLSSGRVILPIAAVTNDRIGGFAGSASNASSKINTCYAFGGISANGGSANNARGFIGAPHASMATANNYYDSGRTSGTSFAPETRATPFTTADTPDNVLSIAAIESIIALESTPVPVLEGRLSGRSDSPNVAFDSDSVAAKAAGSAAAALTFRMKEFDPAALTETGGTMLMDVRRIMVYTGGGSPDPSGITVTFTYNGDKDMVKGGALAVNASALTNGQDAGGVIWMFRVSATGVFSGRYLSADELTGIVSAFVYGNRVEFSADCNLTGKIYIEVSAFAEADASYSRSEVITVSPSSFAAGIGAEVARADGVALPAGLGTAENPYVLQQSKGYKLNVSVTGGDVSGYTVTTSAGAAKKLTISENGYIAAIDINNVTALGTITVTSAALDAFGQPLTFTIYYTAVTAATNISAQDISGAPVSVEGSVTKKISDNKVILKFTVANSADQRVVITPIESMPAAFPRITEVSGDGSVYELDISVSGYFSFWAVSADGAAAKMYQYIVTIPAPDASCVAAVLSDGLDTPYNTASSPWTNHDVIITNAAALPSALTLQIQSGGAWEDFTSLTLGSTGVYNLKFRYYDNAAGAASAVFQLSPIRIEKYEPGLTLQKSALYSGASVTFTLTPINALSESSDASTLYYYTVNGGADWTQIGANMQATLPVGQGFTVTFKAVTPGLNSYFSEPFTADPASAANKLLIDYSGVLTTYTAEDVVFFLRPETGVSNIKYQYSTVAAAQYTDSAASASWIDISGASFRVTANMDLKFRMVIGTAVYPSLDMQGNLNFRYSVRIDKTPAAVDTTAKLVPDGLGNFPASYVTSYTVTVSYTVPVSGATVNFYYNGALISGAALSLASGARSASFTFDRNGVYLVRAVTGAGLVSEKTVTVNRIAQAVGALTVTGLPAAYAQKADLTLSVASGIVHQATVQYTDTFNNQGLVTDITAGYPYFTATQNGTYKFTVKGAVGAAQTYTVVIDKIDVTKPIMTITYDASGWTSSGGEFRIDTFFGISGKKSVTVSFNNGGALEVTGSTLPYLYRGAYTFTATSNSGVTTTRTIDILNIDEADSMTMSVVCDAADTTPSAPFIGQKVRFVFGVQGYKNLIPQDIIAPVTYYYSVNGGGNWTAVTGNTLEINYNTDSVFRFKAVTGAGLTAAPAQEYYVRTNVSIPSIDIVSGLIGGNAVLTVTSRNTYGGYTVYYRVYGSGAYIELPGGVLTVPVSEGAPAQYFDFKIKAAVGGWENELIKKVVVLDAVEPMVAVTPSGPYGEDKWYSGFTFGLEGTFGLSGGSFKYQMTTDEAYSVWSPWYDVDGNKLVINYNCDAKFRFKAVTGMSAESEPVDTGVVRVDLAPVISNVVKTPVAYTAGEVSVTFTVTVGKSMLRELRLVLPGGATAYLNNDQRSFAATSNGDYLIIAINKAGAVGEYRVTVDNIDAVVPAFDITVEGSVSGWTSQDVRFNIAQRNAAGTLVSGISYFYLALPFGELPPAVYTRNDLAAWIPLAHDAGNRAQLTVSSDGDYMYYFIAVSGAGTLSASHYSYAYRVRIDKTAPNLSVAASASDVWKSNIWQGTAGRLIITASFGPLGGKVYYVNGSAETELSEIQPGVYQFTVVTNDTYTFRARPNNGLAPADSFINVHHIDLYAPVFALDVDESRLSDFDNTNWQNLPITFRILPVADNASPVKYFYLYFASGSWHEVEITEFGGKQVTFSSNGCFEVIFRAESGAGKSYRFGQAMNADNPLTPEDESKTEVNQASAAALIYFDIDTEPPTIGLHTPSGQPANYTSGPVTLYFDAVFGGSGGKVYRVVNGAVTGAPLAGEGGVYHYTVYESGTYFFRAVSESNAVSHDLMVTVDKIDTAAPAFTVDVFNYNDEALALSNSALFAHAAGTNTYTLRNWTPGALRFNLIPGAGTITSGVSYFYSVDGGGFVRFPGPLTLTCSADGTHTYVFYAITGAGVPYPEAGREFRFVFGIDKAVPSISCVKYIPDGTYTQNGYNLILGAEFGISGGGGSIFLIENGVTAGGALFFTQAGATSISGQNYYVGMSGTYSFRAVSAAGLYREITVTVTNIDQTQPEYSVRIRYNGADYTVAQWAAFNTAVKWIPGSAQIIVEKTSAGSAPLRVNFLSAAEAVEMTGDSVTYTVSAEGAVDYRITVANVADRNAAADTNITVRINTGTPTLTQTEYVYRDAPDIRYVNGPFTITLLPDYITGGGKIHYVEGNYDLNADNKFTFAANTTYTFYAETYAGIRSGSLVIVVNNIDASSAQFTVTASGATGGWTRYDVTFTFASVSPSIPSGIRYYYRTADMAAGEWVPVTGTSFTPVVADGASHSAVYRFKAVIGAKDPVTGADVEWTYNGAGNIKDFSVMIDKKAPVLSFDARTFSGAALTSGEWTRDTISIILSLTGGTPDSGITYQYSATGAGNSFTAITVPYPVTSSGTYYFRAISGSGIPTDIVTFVARIDRQQPVIKVAGSTDSGVWTNGNINITLSITGTAASGVTYQVCAGADIEENYIDVPGGNTMAITADGIVAYYFRAVSGAGVVSAAYAFTAKIDRIVPDFDFVPGIGSGVWTNGSISFTFGVNNTVPSGVKYQFRKDAGSYQDLPGATFTVTDAGKTNYSFRAVSGAGTASEPVSYAAWIDNSASFALVLSPTVASNTWTSGSISVSLSVLNAPPSGVKYQVSTVSASDGFTDITTAGLLQITEAAATAAGKSYWLRAVSLAGITGGATEYIAKIDRFTPSAQSDYVSHGGTALDPIPFTSADVLISLAGSFGVSGGGVYRVEGGAATGSPITSFTAVRNGTYTFRAVSGAGIAGPDLVVTVNNIDKNTPAFTVSSVGKTGGWTNGDVTFTLASSQAHPEGVTMEYYYRYAVYNADGTPKAAAGAWALMPGGVLTVSAPAAGFLYREYFFMAVSNILDASQSAVSYEYDGHAERTVMIDRTVPAFTVEDLLTHWTNGGAAIRLTPGAIPSGVLELQVSVNNGSTWNAGDFSAQGGGTYIFTAEARKAYSFRIRSGSGEYSGPITIEPPMIDREDTEMGVTTAYNGQPTTAGVVFNFTRSNKHPTGDGVEITFYYSYSDDGGINWTAWAAVTGASYTTGANVPAETLLMRTYRFKMALTNVHDDAGTNVADPVTGAVNPMVESFCAQTVTVNYDTLTPQIQIRCPANSGGWATPQTGIRIYVDAWFAGGARAFTELDSVYRIINNNRSSFGVEDVQAIDNGDGSYTYSFLVRANTQYIFAAESLTGRRSAPMSIDINRIEETAPQFDAVVLQGKTGGWTSSDVVFGFRLQNTVASGVSYFYCTDYNEAHPEDAVWLPVSDPSAGDPRHTVSVPEGQSQILFLKFMARSGSGVLTVLPNLFEVKIDKALPVIGAPQGIPGAWTNRDQTITVEVNYNFSREGSSVIVRNVTTNTVISITGIEDADDGVTRIYSFIVTANGAYEIDVVSGSGAAASSSFNITYIEKFKPVFGGVSDSVTVYKPLTVTITIAKHDNYGYTYSITKDGKAYEAELINDSISFNGTGSYTVTVTDDAGNVSVLHFSMQRPNFLMIGALSGLGLIAVAALIVLLVVTARQRKAMRRLIAANTVSDTENQFVMFKKIK